MSSRIHEPSDAETRTWADGDVALALPSADPSSVVMRFLADEILDERFRIVRFLGQGGMGQVYEAEDLELGVRVALKAVRPERGHSSQSIARFKREVHLARQVTHRNVCRIFELFHLRAGNDWGKAARPQLLVTMELLDGETLAARLRRAGPIPPREALPIIRELAAALDTAHQAGVLHLDFKSSNVMLASSVDRLASASGPPGRRAVVTDFGLARTSDRDGFQTLAGRQAGTPAYMAPEIADGVAATAAADIYAFGVVMFEMLTGQLPFAERSAAEPPDAGRGAATLALRAHCPDLSPHWEAVVMRCLAHRPEQRFTRASDVAKALVPSPRKRWWRSRAIVGTCLALALFGLSLFFDLPGGSEPAAIVQEAPFVGADTAPVVGPPAPASLVLRGPDLGRPTGAEAAQLYARGAWLLDTYDLAPACDLLTQAAELEPESAAVHAVLSRCWSLRGYEARAQAAAQQAFASSAPLGASARRFLQARVAETARQFEPAREHYEALWTAMPDVHEYGLHLAKVQAASGDPASGLTTVEQVRSRLESSSAPPRVDLVEAEVARFRGDLGRQRRLAAQVAVAAKAMDAQLLLARARLLEAEALDLLGQREDAITAVGEARWIYERHADDRGLAWSVLALRDRVPYASNPKLSPDYSGTIEIFRAVGDRSGEALSLTRWGRQLLRQEQPDRAAEVLDQSLALARLIGDRVTEAEALSHQAVLIWALEDSVGALQRFADAVAASTRSGNLHLRSRALANLGNGHMSLQQLGAARQSYEEALAISAQVGSRYDRGVLLFQYAGTLMRLGEVEAAENQLQEATVIAQASGHAGLISWATRRRADIDACRGRFAEALQRFDEPMGESLKRSDVYHIIGRAPRLLAVAPAQAEKSLRDIESAIDPKDQWLLLQYRRQLAAALLAQQKNEEAAAVLVPLRSTLATYPEPDLRQAGMLLLARIDAVAGRLDEALPVIDGIVEEARGSGAVMGELEARMHKVQALFSASEMDRAEHELDLLKRDAEAIGCPGIAILAQRRVSEPAT